MPEPTEFLPRKKILYQFGDGLSNYFIFPSVDLKITNKTGLKTNYANNRLTDGLINLSLTQPFKKEAYSYTATFLIKKSDLFDVDYVKSVFWDGYRALAFFYDLDITGYMQFYFTYLTVTVPMIDDYNSQENYNQTHISYTIELTAENPFLYACDTSLAYFDKNAYVINERRWDDGSFWDSGVWDPGIALATIPISSLTLNQRLNLFYQCSGVDNALVYTDRFFNPTSYSVTSNLIVNRTLTSNSLVDIQTTNLLSDTSALNKIYIIEISQMTQNNTLSILNLSNNSGLLFTWKSAVASPSLFYFNSFKNRCYTSSGVLIPATDIKIEQQNNSFLYFNSKRTLNSVISVSNDNIRLQKNSSSNITLKIEALKTYH